MEQDKNMGSNDGDGTYSDLEGFKLEISSRGRLK